MAEWCSLEDLVNLVLGETSFVARSLLETACSSGIPFQACSRQQCLGQAENDWKDADVIVNCLAAGVQSGVETTFPALLEANALWPMRLALELEQTGFRGTLVTFGSYFELGRWSSLTPADELQILTASHPVGEYGGSKRVLTRFASEFQQRCSYRLLHLILPNVYGRGENSNRLIPYLFERCSQGAPISLTSGSQKRQYLHVRDLSSLLIRFCQDRELPGGVFCVAPQEVLSISEVARECLMLFSQHSGKPVPESQPNQQRGDVDMPYLALDSSRAVAQLGFTPAVTLSEGLRSYLEPRLAC